MIIVGGVTLGGGLMLIGRHGDTQRLLPAPENRTLCQMRQGDALAVMGETFLVEGCATFTEQGTSRWAYRISDGPTRRWFYVQRSDEIRAWLLDEAQGLDFDARPPDSLTHQGVGFRLEILGKTRVSLEGQTDRSPQAGQIEYYHFKGFGDHVLVVERWGPGECRSMTGRQVEVSGVELLPGDPVSKRS